MAAETGFLIDGTVYEVPALLSLDMAERHVMYDLSEYIQEDFLRGEDEPDDEYEGRVDKLMRHPGVMEALMHIAYQRGNPSVKRDKVRFVIDKTNYLDAISTMSAPSDEDVEEDAVPLALTTPPDEPSPNAPSSPNDSSEPANDSPGTDSTNDSGQQAVPPTPIGTLRSATSSPESPQTESVG